MNHHDNLPELKKSDGWYVALLVFLLLFIGLTSRCDCRAEYKSTPTEERNADK